MNLTQILGTLVGTLPEFEIKTTIEAGGPGSGRKPEFNGNKKLEKAHNKMLKNGYQFTHTSVQNKGADQHHYYTKGKGANQQHGIVSNESGKISMEHGLKEDHEGNLHDPS